MYHNSGIDKSEGSMTIHFSKYMLTIDPVKEKAAQNKSMLASKNLPEPITKASQASHWIRVLAAELALRLKDAREINPTLWPKTLVLHAKQGIRVQIPRLISES